MGKKKKYVKEKYCEILLATYNHTQSEITRYRDREWAIPGIFIAAMITTIGFIISNPKDIKNLHFTIDIFLFILAMGNTFYSLLTHKKLTKQRIVRNNIEYALGIQDYPVDGKNIFEDYKIQAPNDIDFHTEWLKGFWDHILPFIIAGWILFLVGKSILFKPYNIFLLKIIHAMIILFFTCMYYLSE